MNVDNFGRVPPQDKAAEQSVLGAMLMSKDAISSVMDIINGSDMYYPAHEEIFNTILRLFAEGVPVDAITVADALTRAGVIARVGGHIYIGDLMAAVPIAANASFYAAIVRDKAILRRLIEAGTRIVQLGHEGTEDVDDLVDHAQKLTYDISMQQPDSPAHSVGSLLPPTWDYLDVLSSHDGRLVGVPTGFTDIDSLTQGFQPGQMIIIAARPSMGKSTLALDIARNAALRHKMATAVFSLEMSYTEIMLRLLSAESSTPLRNLRTGNLGEYWDRLSAVTPSIESAPLFIDESPSLTMMEIRTRARQLKLQQDLKLIIIDYVQLLATSQRGENRQVEVSEISRHVKLLAKELDVPVVAVSQLNRMTEYRADKIPLLSDLRESGALEQDADIVMLLHRPEFFDKDTRPGEADLIVAKNRNGPTATITLVSQLSMSRFVDNPDTHFRIS